MNYHVLVLAVLLVFCSVPAAVSAAGGVDGNGVVKDARDMERVDFIHFKKAKPGGGKPGGDTCYKLMGVKWNTLPVNYTINPTNSNGLTESFVTAAVSTSADTWDADTTPNLFNDAYSVDYNASYGVLDGKNSLVFGSYSNSGVIAITSIWYNRKTKQIGEFDILFNTYYQWGDAEQDPALMDLQNIATHELGHGIGLNDIYRGACSAVTMYGYSDNGETDKRTLEQPDITGLQSMYGA
ncbi:MAG: matrixin family metalloprotease [Candidatus Altiarchaeota archaeon]